MQLPFKDLLESLQGEVHQLVPRMLLSQEPCDLAPLLALVTLRSMASFIPYQKYTPYPTVSRKHLSPLVIGIVKVFGRGWAYFW